MRLNWLPSLVITAVVAGGLGAGSAYLQRHAASTQTSSAEASSTTALLQQTQPIAESEGAPLNSQLRTAFDELGVLTLQAYDEVRNVLERRWERLAANVFRVSSVRIEGNYRVPDRVILRSADLLIPPSVFEADLQGRREQLLRMPWIAEATIETDIFPNRILLTVKEKEPWLVAEYEGHSWLVDRSGTLIETLTAPINAELVLEMSELPRLGGLDAKENVQSFLRSPNARFEYAIETLRLLELAGGLPFAVERYELLPQGAIRVSALDLRGAPEILLAPTDLDSAQTAIRQLGAVLSDLTQRNEQAREIDLRYQGQAVVR
ncbi:MAG: FtsQ-type POTRA domain-containing protein [Bdellovibrionales bacterium]|nr:FtsQ-type POTRA domain-containing protein [Bdellovibrionales bacterium]